MTVSRVRQAGTRALLATVIAVAVLALGGPANADPAYGRVFHDSFTGQAAIAIWQFRPSATTQVDAFVNGIDGNQTVMLTSAGERAYTSHGLGWLFDVQVSDLDADGNKTGGIDYFGFFSRAFGDSSYFFSVDRLLRGASAGGSALATTACTYDANGFFTGCVDTTADARVTWTGQGRIFRGGEAFHDKAFGFVLNETIAGSGRAATASGVIAGVTLPPTPDVQTPSNFAHIENEAEGEVFACIGNPC